MINMGCKIWVSSVSFKCSPRLLLSNISGSGYFEHCRIWDERELYFLVNEVCFYWITVIIPNSIGYAIFGEGSQISTYQERESTDFSILIG